jgi:hypothetical protein
MQYKRTLFCWACYCSRILHFVSNTVHAFPPSELCFGNESIVRMDKSELIVTAAYLLYDSDQPLPQRG